MNTTPSKRQQLEVARKGRGILLSRFNCHGHSQIAFSSKSLFSRSTCNQSLNSSLHYAWCIYLTNQFRLNRECIMRFPGAICHEWCLDVVLSWPWLSRSTCNRSLDSSQEHYVWCMYFPNLSRLKKGMHHAVPTRNKTQSFSHYPICYAQQRAGTAPYTCWLLLALPCRMHVARTMFLCFR